MGLLGSNGILKNRNKKTEKPLGYSPKKLTPKLIKKMSALVQNGAKLKDACSLLKISESTYYKWLEEAEDEENTDPLLQEFSLEMKHAEAKNKQFNIVKIQKDKSWRAAAWWLEKKYPDEFGKEERIITENTTRADVKFVKEAVEMGRKEFKKKFVSAQDSDDYNKTLPEIINEERNDS